MTVMINDDPWLFSQSSFTKSHQILQILSSSRSFPSVCHFALGPNYFLYNHYWTGSKPVSSCFTHLYLSFMLPQKHKYSLFSSAENATVVWLLFINSNFLKYFLIVVQLHLFPFFLPLLCPALHTPTSHMQSSPLNCLCPQVLLYVPWLDSSPSFPNCFYVIASLTWNGPQIFI